LPDSTRTVDRSDMRPGGRGGMIVPAWNSETAREATRISWEKRRERARRAALAGLHDASKNMLGVRGDTPEHVVRYAVEQHAMNMVDPSTRNSVQSLRAVMSIAFPESRGNESGNFRAVGDGERAAVAKLVALLEAAEAADPAFAARVAALVAEREGR